MLNSIMGNKVAITRGEVYKTLEKTSVPHFDRRYQALNTAQKCGIRIVCTGLILGILITVAIAIMNAINGVPFYSLHSMAAMSYSIASTVVICGLSVLMVSTVKKKSHLNERLKAKHVKIKLEEIKQRLHKKQKKIEDFKGFRRVEESHEEARLRFEREGVILQELDDTLEKLR